MDPSLLAIALKSQPMQNTLNRTATLAKALRNPETYRYIGQELTNWPQPNEAIKQQLHQGAMDIGLMLNPMAMNVIAYHGSPYKFDKFHMSKVGTGEGAQAYGHGLYFAENPEVAKFYQPMPIDVVAGRTLTKAEDRAFGRGMRTLIDMGGDVDKARISLLNQAKILTRQGPDYASAVNEVNKAREMLDTGAFKIKKATASLYKVDIPDEAVAKMLDWDKPLSQQPEGVRNVIQNFAKNTEFDTYDNLALASVIGKHPRDQTYQAPMSEVLNDIANIAGFRGKGPELTKFLYSQGIPGIKYLDQGSRTAGQGTHNYVVFDENLPKILERQ